MRTLTRRKPKPASFSLGSIWHELTRDRSDPNKVKIATRDLTTIFSMLSALLDNGMPLQRALRALANDRSLKKHWELLKQLEMRLVEGATLHKAMSNFSNAFTPAIIQQIRLGEMSGQLSDALKRINRQLESWLSVRNTLTSKLSYPALVIVAGSGLMVFMLTSVVPQFETIYSESQVDLPWVTQVITSLSRGLFRYGWLLLIPFGSTIALYFWIRRDARARKGFDRSLLRVPVLGAFVADVAVLQFLRGVHALSEAGFVPIDAITQASSAVTNRQVQSELQMMSRLLSQGTKLSVALERVEQYVPSTVQQLIMVGEHSGDITAACEGACEFVTNRLQRRINSVMAMVEPALTIGLAACIGWIVLAMYMPMFKMFDVLDF